MDPNDWTLTGNTGTDPASNFLGTTDTEPLIIRTNGVEHLRITPDGNVGIGTATPGSTLVVVQANSTAMQALSGDENSNTSITIGRTADEGRLGVAANSGQFANDASPGDIILRTETTTSRLLLGTGTGNSALAIQNGNVGIGTSGPSSKLEVGGQLYINMTDAPSGTTSNLLSFLVGVSGFQFHWGHFYLNPASIDNRFYFGASNSLTTNPPSPMMTWDVGTGNVGIGTATPGSKLAVVQANSAAMQALSGDENSNTSITIGRTADEGRLGVAANSGQFANDAFAGDIILRTETAEHKLLFGNGPDHSTMAIAFGRVTVTGTSGVGLIANAGTGGAGLVGTGQTGIICLRTPGGKAGFFGGDVEVTGFLSKDGGGFQIDHPLDPAHKSLLHSFVESPDMKNIYDGVVVLDIQGEAEVTLPVWFDVLNTDFRYQLTAIGAAGPDLHIAEETSANRFKIAGGKPQMKVCWQVTGIRQDAWARAHPLSVEQDKPAQEHGYYRHPELYGESEQKNIMQVRYPALKHQLWGTQEGNGDS